MTEVSFLSTGSIQDSQLRFAVIMATFRNKWIFCRHKSRSTWEIPGGHREIREKIEETARRELYEETGATDAKIHPVCVYAVNNGNRETYGMLFFAEVERLSSLDPRFEIAEIIFADNLPEQLTYPLIQPYLFARVDQTYRVQKREAIVAPYDPDWKTLFEEIKTSLENIFCGIHTDIRHFGSTSVEGMPAKPIIDVMVLVKNITTVDTYNANMIEAGYVPKGEHGIAGRRYFQKFAPDGVNHTAHIHCYEYSHPHAVDELMFCEFLRRDKEAFEHYKKVKTEASEKYRFSPVEYTEYKSECISSIMKQARHFFDKT